MLTQAIKTATARTPADIANATHLSHDQAEKVFTWAHRRASNRESGRLDFIVVVEGWAVGYPPDDPIANGRVMLVGRVEDYSEKAFKFRGAFDIDMDAEIDTDLLDVLSFVHDKGVGYVPKSAVQEVFEIV